MHEADAALTLGPKAIQNARERFLTRQPSADVNVRRMILASWQRSRDNAVGIDSIRVPYVRDPDLEAPLFRSASPILDTLDAQLQGESISIILTDHTGTVVDRRSSGRDMTQRLDRVRLAPGFSYAEEFAGTNGIGTSLSSGRPTLVDGREHYTSELGQFACAGAPIRHPIRGKVVGVLDLTTSSNAPGAMLTALASATARQIEQELAAQTGMRELALFSEYQRTCQHSTGPVLALNNDVVMTNALLRQLANAAEHEALVAYAIDTMRSAERAVMRTVELPSGRSAQLKYLPVRCDGGLAGGVFRIRLGQLPETTGGRSIGTSRGEPALALPGLVGNGAVWTRCVQQVDSRYRAGDWVALEGEPGTGKRSLLRAVHRLHNPAAHLRVLDPPTDQSFPTWLAALAADLGMPGAMVVLARADQLTDEQAGAVSDLLTEVGADTERHARVAITTTAGAPAALLSVFPRTVEVPPLRHHIDDIAELVQHLLSQLPEGDRLTCSPAALGQLSRLNWPGNVAQLRTVLAHVTQHHRAGSIEIADLPPECRSTSRRVLSPIEALERDAIVTALRDKGQSPTTAARSLGMSRATIYRKIRQYDIFLTVARKS